MAKVSAITTIISEMPCQDQLYLVQMIAVAQTVVSQPPAPLGKAKRLQQNVLKYYICTAILPYYISTDSQNPNLYRKEKYRRN